jgi:hypothetical protein
LFVDGDGRYSAFALSIVGVCKSMEANATARKRGEGTVARREH